MRILTVKARSPLGQQWIDDAGTDVWVIVAERRVTRLHGKPCYLIEPLSLHPDDTTHIVRTSQWVLQERDKNLTWVEDET